MKEQFTDHHNQKIYLHKIRRQMFGKYFPWLIVIPYVLINLVTVYVDHILDNLEIILTDILQKVWCFIFFLVYITIVSIYILQSFLNHC